MTTKKQRRKFSSEFKTKVVLEAIKEQETLNKLSDKFSIQTNQILNWKKEFLENATVAFEKKSESEEHEKEKDHLFKKIGQLEVERDWLKKISKQLGLPTERP